MPCLPGGMLISWLASELWSSSMASVRPLSARFLPSKTGGRTVMAIRARDIMELRSSSRHSIYNGFSIGGKSQGKEQQLLVNIYKVEKLSDISLVTKVVMLHDSKSFDLLVRKYQSPIRGFFLRQTLGMRS